MDILEQIKKILKGENKFKIIGLAALIVLCFVLVYATSNPFRMTDSIEGTDDAEYEMKHTDFADVLACVEGAGKVSVYITYEDEHQSSVRGIIIVAEGAKDLSVKMKLQQAAACAYGIDIDRIEVFQMKGVS